MNCYHRIIYLKTFNILCVCYANQFSLYTILLFKFKIKNKIKTYILCFITNSILLAYILYYTLIGKPIDYFFEITKFYFQLFILTAIFIFINIFNNAVISILPKTILVQRSTLVQKKKNNSITCHKIT